MEPIPVDLYVISKHARFEMLSRSIPIDVVRRVLHHPEQRFEIRKGREVFQSRIQSEDKRYLIRVFVDVDRQPVEVVTVYRTSKVEKYWRARP